jgi:hypothetical protein
MDRSKGLSNSERQELLERIKKLLGDTPKGKLVRELVESLPAADDPPPGEDSPPGEVVPEAH